jgi:hypothetical protein
MSRSDPPESTVKQLHALYHEAATDEPGSLLDRSILDAARADLRIDRGARRPTPWWKGWMTAASAIAVAAVGLSLTWRVMDEQERQLREEMSAARVAGEMADKAASTPRPAEVTPVINAPAPAAASSVARSVDAAPVPARQRPTESVAFPVVPAPAVPAAIAPVMVEEVMKKSQRAEPEAQRERRDEGFAAGAAPSPARAKGKTEAKGFGASSEAAVDSHARPFVAQPAADAATPEAWLKHVRELQAAGRSAEAAQSLVRFRARYPDVVLPDDLLNLK